MMQLTNIAKWLSSSNSEAPGWQDEFRGPRVHGFELAVGLVSLPFIKKKAKKKINCHHGSRMYPQKEWPWYFYAFSVYLSETPFIITCLTATDLHIVCHNLNEYFVLYRITSSVEKRNCPFIGDAGLCPFMYNSYKTYNVSCKQTEKTLDVDCYFFISCCVIMPVLGRNSHAYIIILQSSC